MKNKEEGVSLSIPQLELFRAVYTTKTVSYRLIRSKFTITLTDGRAINGSLNTALLKIRKCLIRQEIR
jgi:hypothetical protein